MELRELRYIREIAKTGNLTKAAENLFVSQPNLSKVIRKLETELNTPLFYRKGKQLFPTEAGTILISGADGVLQQVGRVEEQISSLNKLEKGRVFLGIPAVIARLYFTPILVDFKSRHKDIEIHMMEGGGLEVQDKVTAGELDLGITMRPVISSELNEFVIVSDELVVGMNKDHPLASRAAVQMEDLAVYPYTTFDTGYCINMRLNERLQALGLQGKAALLAREFGLLTDFSRAADCLCLGPAPVLHFYSWPGMVIKPFSPGFPWEISIIYRKNIYLSPATREFIHTITKYFISDRDPQAEPV